MTIKDCNTCVNHKQGEHPSVACQSCLDLSSTPYFDLPYWKAKAMSDGASEMSREEKKSGLDAIWENRLPGTIPATQSAFDTQVGGEHYKTMKIQPVEFAVANKLDFFQKDIIKYVTRRKGDRTKRMQDLEKAKHYLEMYMEAVVNGYN